MRLEKEWQAKVAAEHKRLGEERQTEAAERQRQRIARGPSMLFNLCESNHVSKIFDSTVTCVPLYEDGWVRAVFRSSFTISSTAARSRSQDQNTSPWGRWTDTISVSGKS